MTQKKAHREFWIDDIFNVDRPHTKTAYIYEQDTEKFNGKSIHVIEHSALEAEQAKVRRFVEALKRLDNESLGYATIYSIIKEALKEVGEYE
jgi:hypothetical protein